MMGRWSIVTMLIGISGCNFLAQSDTFAWMRPGLIEECCSCLANSNSDDFAASCEPAGVRDGEVVPIEPGQPPVPCLCADMDATEGFEFCVARLSAAPPADRSGSAADELVVNGSCVAEGGGACTGECTGVLSFAPLPEVE